MESLELQTLEVCPSCGDFGILNPQTGWCTSCSNEHQPVCNRCGTPVEVGSLCWECRRLTWLETNAERIEDKLLDGQSLRESIKDVHDEIRSSCIICGNPIRRGTNGRHFICNNSPQCKKARRRYKYLMYDKGYSKARAIEMVIGGKEDSEHTRPNVE